MKAFVVLVLAVLCAVVAPAAAQDQCSICEFAVQYIDGWLAENSTEAQIERYMEVVCALAPSSEAQICDDFVVRFVPAVITYLNNNIPPQYICSLLGVCTSEKARSLPAEITEAIKAKVNRAH
eukprot:TRINITY_DN9552_c0_g1_i1.p1 TRINITY_DN9552_c0_g1~~TRINITY_DN9552_c0_g1_i1.p1  ORF type:complete len:136 (+),score=32.93 TRINITY_DN9552_c0_g1_i1:40-408(+)